MLNWGSMVPFLTKQTQRTIGICAIDWSTTGKKQFLYDFHKHSEKRKFVHCKDTLVLSIFIRSFKIKKLEKYIVYYQFLIRF